VAVLVASRLAPNPRDWHTLLEFCGLVGTLIADEDGVYDPRQPNDRLLLGMKGTMSEMELSVLRQRSLEALKQKARRGELFMTVAIVYVRVGHNRIEKGPDRRVGEAIALVFAKFTEMQSVRQVHLWFRHERIPLPAVTYGAEGRLIEWKLPVYNTILHILTNPIYTGTYAFGRTGSRICIEAGRKKVVRGFKKERKDWEVLIPNHHEGYLSWADYERNLGLIADNANGKNPMSRGALREALLVGLLRCGHCGRKLHVAYSGKDGNTGRYHCRGGANNHGGDACISFGGMRIDRDVAAEVIERLQPLGIEAALAAQAAQPCERRVSSTGARYRMSLISAVTSRGQMRFMTKEKGGVNAAVFIEFLKRLMIGSRNKIFLIVDRGPAHVAKKTKLRRSSPVSAASCGCFFFRHIRRTETPINWYGSISNPMR
jgi:hypothetical protein